MKLQLLPTQRLRSIIRLGRRLGLSTLLWLSLPGAMVKAQVVPDGSLESAVQQIQELMKIEGGQRAGNNLFHSFEEFSVPAGMEAVFENATDIENIFTRVTGDSVSAIDGILSAQGGANLFLMNPNGIVFGTDASINIGGSFIATTADSIQFDNGEEFAASDAENDALINVRFPVAFGFNKLSEGSITVNGVGNEITSASPVSPTTVESSQQGLEVESGNTLGLVGSSVTVDGGTLTAESGNIEVGSVKKGVVGIQPTQSGFTFDYGNVNNYQNIDITNQAVLGSSGKEAGAISLTGSNIAFSNGSLALLQNNETSVSGDINITASESLALNGISSDGQMSSGIRTQSVSTSKGGDIAISTPSLSLLEGARIATDTYNDAPGGNIVINSNNFTQLSNSGSPRSFGISTFTFGSGSAGNITLSTEQLGIEDGGSVASGTFGTGNAGIVDINANSVKIVGAANRGESGAEPSQINSATVGEGNAGTIKVDTATLEIIDGGRIFASSFGNGDAGNIFVSATSSINISGQDETQTQQSLIGSNVRVSSTAFQDAVGITTLPSGEGGNVSINTPNLNINQGGSISVENQGTGAGGNIELNADNLQINSDSEITATAEGKAGGGNVTINATNITAKKQSAISANAEGGDGGNITIGTDTLLGIDNSDITANAVEGDGGNITITADAIVGFAERAELTPLSDITASSDFGTAGVITINSPDSSADEELEIAARQVESENLAKDFAQSCSQGRGKFTYSGLGIPQNPDRYFDNTGEYSAEEVSEVQPKYPPIGFPQTEQQKKDMQRFRQNRQQRQSEEQPTTRAQNARGTASKQKRQVRGEIVIAEIDSNTGRGYPIIYSETNTIPPRLNAWRKPGAPREEANAIQINPNGEHYMVRIAQIEHPSDQVCTATDNSATDN